MTSHGTIGRVGAVHRYPVKSLSGEPLDEVVLDRRGVVGDRLWSVRDPDGKFGSGKSSKRFRRMDGLLALTAEYDGDVPVVTFPDGRRLRPGPELDEALSWHVGGPVSLGQEGDVSHFDDGPVHLTGHNLPAYGVARVGPVYTPREHRGRGYASAAVADVSGRLREAGSRVCLFTDQANPTSNRIYEAIGYRRVVDMANLVLAR